MDQKRISREKEFYNISFSRADSNRREPVLKYYSIMDYARKFYMSIITKHCFDKKLLEYGCGTGSPETWEKRHAHVFGIDISDEGVKKANKISREKGLNAQYYVMNAEHTEFPDNFFDIIIGSGILHHLELKKAYLEINRLLKQNGCAVFIEPLGHNPFIALYRKLTPKMRTDDEHPLTMSDILLANNFFKKTETSYFNLFTFLAVPFRKSRHFEKILNSLISLEQHTMKHYPFLKKYAWVIVLKFEYPKKN